MRGALARLVRAVVPHRFHRSARLTRLLDQLVAGRVVGGPFAGLRYAERSFGSAHWPKLLGTYEREIQDQVEQFLLEPFRNVLVAGAAEGYYAVGFASRMPQVTVIAWEANELARTAVTEMAAANGVGDRIQTLGICDFGSLARALETPGPSLLLMDLDGGEAILLDPVALPHLRDVAILVETHDCFIDGVTDLLARRFASSHVIERVPARARSWSDALPLQVPSSLLNALTQLLSERRPPGNDWLVLRPRGADG